MRVRGLLLAVVALGQGTKVYPGAKKYTPPGTHWSIYLTDDAYEKVVAFYKSAVKEFTIPGMPKDRKLPSGQELKQAYFILDGAADLGSSKSWCEVQRPYVGADGDERWNAGVQGYSRCDFDYGGGEEIGAR